MPDQSPEATEPTFCIGCGYSLRALLTDRCPECGRVFDPADPRTFSRRVALKRWQRSLLRPASWLTISLALVGTLLLICASGWPDWKPVPPSVLAAEFHYRPGRVWPEGLFYAAMLSWAAFVLLAFPRWIARSLLVPRVAIRANLPETNVRLRDRVIRIAVVLSPLWLVFGWEGRVASQWLAHKRIAVAEGEFNYDYWAYEQDPRVPLSSIQAADAFGAALRNGWTAADRLDALGSLAAMGNREAFSSLRRAAARERNADVLSWELELMSLFRDPRSAPLFISSLEDPRPQIRAAAADAIGILRHPSYSISVPDSFYIAEPPSLDIAPPVPIDGIVSQLDKAPNALGRGYVAHDLRDDPPIDLPDSVRSRLFRMMTQANTREEREAAARTLVDWPPDHYKLRVAEWGVWIESSGHMALAKTIVDEIPPFVHRTGNPVSDFSKYFLYPSVVTKPIIHLTSDAPITVDVDVQIRQGRPWFAFPKPDDFGINVEGEGGAYALDDLDWGVRVGNLKPPFDAREYASPSLPAFTDRREGYPWLRPHHRLYESLGNGASPIYQLGVHWQSVIVSPSLLPGDAPLSVPDEPRFQWWARLRQVPSSWVTSRSETERFLYYDGPTRAKVPVSVAMENSQAALRFTSDVSETNFDSSQRRPKLVGTQFHPLMPAPTRHPFSHIGLYIVVDAGILSGLVVSTAGDDSVFLPAHLPLRGRAVVETLRAMLADYGLTPAEAEGLVAAWTPQFFQTEGRRFILQMTPEEYARQCPLQIRPTPTEVVRLGLVLTEFDPKELPHAATSQPQPTPAPR